MTNLTITIECPALEKLAEALAHLNTGGAPAPAPIPAAPAPAAPIAAPVAPLAATPGPAQAVQPPPVVPLAGAPTYTYDQIMKAGAELAAANPARMPELMSLLQRYGVVAVADLKPEQLGAFATELRGLGANI